MSSDETLLVDDDELNDASDLLGIRGASTKTRIFVSDDDDDMRALVTGVLQRDGYEVIGLKDGLETMRQIHGALQDPVNLPDLILLDILMPHYSGLSILRAIRCARWFTPVIMMTALGTDNVTQRARDLGAVAILKKPFNVDELRTAVLNASLIRARAQRSSRNFGREGS